MIDLDWFKPINDTCGHAAGDRVLLQVRDVLERACRSSDTVVRWGGDEFLVVGRVDDLAGVEVVAERVRAMIEGMAFDLGDGQVAHITCSIGFTCYPASAATLLGLSLEQVVSLADKALYAAKKAGRNAWVGLLGTEGMSVDQVIRSLQDDADALLRGGDFEVLRSTDQRVAA
jgi:diguanylate cyclase (GGDEF)-like protein